MLVQHLQEHSHKKLNRIISMMIIVSFAVLLIAPIYTIIYAGHDCVEELCSLCPFILIKYILWHIGGLFAFDIMLRVTFAVLNPVSALNSYANLV